MIGRRQLHIAMMLAATVIVFALAVMSRGLFAASGPGDAPENRFPHDKHARVFPLCTSCHAGVVESGKPVFPEATGCASCHDGTVEKRVAWQPRSGPRATNLRFTHDAHRVALASAHPADSALNRTCATCHTKAGEPRMAVQHAIVGQCLSCHGLKQPHFDVPAAACATCHVRLTDAPLLARADIARFPKPQSHRDPNFILGGHGKLARGTASSGALAVSASCATCHSRNLCLACHVNAPESPVIQALALDDRTPSYASEQPVPKSHRSASFLSTHGREATRAGATCATCHTRESCMSCHGGTPPRAVTMLAVAGPGRAAGARVGHGTPPSHTREFREHHGAEASARPRTCETCHARSTCLECHRPDGARQNGYHPRGFLTRHPAVAYARSTSCSDCHNPAQFCQSCHKQSGLVATARLGQKGYHDAFRGFSLGHGQAARQSLESCASCHAERDCTACHSATGSGFRFSPHGPGFNAARARAKNPSVCAACHGRSIPGG